MAEKANGRPRKKRKVTRVKAPSELSLVIPLFERIQRDVSAIADGVLGLSRQMNQGFKETREHIDGRIEQFSEAMRCLGYDVTGPKSDRQDLETLAIRVARHEAASAVAAHG